MSEFTYQSALKILGGWGDSYNKTSLEQGNPNWPAEVGALLHAAQWAQGVLEVTINICTGNTYTLKKSECIQVCEQRRDLKVGVNLDFLAKPWCLDLDERRRHSLISKGYNTWTDNNIKTPTKIIWLVLSSYELRIKIPSCMHDCCWRWLGQSLKRNDTYLVVITFLLNIARRY